MAVVHLKRRPLATADRVAHQAERWRRKRLQLSPAYLSCCVWLQAVFPCSLCQTMRTWHFFCNVTNSHLWISLITNPQHSRGSFGAFNRICGRHTAMPARRPGPSASATAAVCSCLHPRAALRRRTRHRFPRNAGWCPMGLSSSAVGRAGSLPPDRDPLPRLINRHPHPIGERCILYPPGQGQILCRKLLLAGYQLPRSGGSV